MATPLTKFECFLPIIPTTTTLTNAFLDSIGAITTFVQSEVGFYNSSTTLLSQYVMIFGLLTSIQATSALSALSTLNTGLTALGVPTVVAYSYTITTQP